MVYQSLLTINSRAHGAPRAGFSRARVKTIFRLESVSVQGFHGGDDAITRHVAWSYKIFTTLQKHSLTTALCVDEYEVPRLAIASIGQLTDTRAP